MKQNKTKQNKTKQSKAKKSKVKQNKAKGNIQNEQVIKQKKTYSKVVLVDERAHTPV